MADIEMIIKIPDHLYKLLKDFPSDSNETTIENVLIKAVENGTPIPDNIGDFSDGYHTFNQLYHQRAVLFATIVNLNKNISWKSWKHDDGKYCFDSNGEWFIVGIDTPQGSYTYHYEKAYWDMFKCQELANGKHWDGHTEDDVIRLLSLVPLVPIPDNATNGEVIEALYPDAEFSLYSDVVDRVAMNTRVNGTEYEIHFDEDWWDTPYQKGKK